MSIQLTYNVLTSFPTHLNRIIKMNEFELSQQSMIEHQILDLCSTLNNINYQLAELNIIKEELDKKLSALLEHGDEGQKTYQVGKHKITVKSGYNYSLNKEEYESIGSRIPRCFNPVKKKISYELDKNIIRDCERYGSSDDVNLLAQVIIKKPAKLSVRIQPIC